MPLRSACCRCPRRSFRSLRVEGTDVIIKALVHGQDVVRRCARYGPGLPRILRTQGDVYDWARRPSRTLRKGVNAWNRPVSLETPHH